MDLINDFLYQIMKNTTIELKINIPINPLERSSSNNFFQSALNIPNNDNKNSERSTTFRVETCEPSTLRTEGLGETLQAEGSQGPISSSATKSDDFVRHFFENLATNTQEEPQPNDDIYTLINQLELVISTLQKILAKIKTQQTNNEHYLVMINNYIEMLENIDRILKSFKLIRSSFNF
jgi:hypothetical protein